MTNNLYKIARAEHGGWDTFDSAVVVAESSKEAKMIHPNIYSYEEIDDWSWINADDVIVTYLGIADSNLKKGVIVASFNAG